jgi:hypothetical protein
MNTKRVKPFSLLRRKSRMLHGKAMDVTSVQ